MYNKKEFYYLGLFLFGIPSIVSCNNFKDSYNNNHKQDEKMLRSFPENQQNNIKERLTLLLNSIRKRINQITEQNLSDQDIIKIILKYPYLYEYNYGSLRADSIRDEFYIMSHGKLNYQTAQNFTNSIFERSIFNTVIDKYNPEFTGEIKQIINNNEAFNLYYSNYQLKFNRNNEDITKSIQCVLQNVIQQ